VSISDKMPQGKFKTKVQLPSNIKKKSTVNKGKVSKTKMNKKKNSNLGNKKTGLEAVQQRLTTQIAKNIEQECANKVKSNEGKSLLLVKPN
jgi:hypothetical protein